MSATKIGHGLAKVLGIKLDDPNPADKVTRGESTYSVSSADTYIEEEPTVLEWIHEITPDRKAVWTYVAGLFPFVHWITRYNLQWFYGDLVAGTLN
jgi:sodium-independent sulfate anion transporter 11